MTTTAIETEWQPVNLSKYHDGQIVTPRVSRKTIRDSKDSKQAIYAVRLRWYDAGDQGITEVGEHRGNYWECTEWLAGHGIHIDDSRF